MKPKSSKLRFLATLHILHKYSDKNHRLNALKLNEYLKPYGMEYSRHILKETVGVLQEIGVDIRSGDDNYMYGVWLEERPLTSHALKQLIFAITTNPYLTREEKDTTLESLTPFVSVFQEPLLKSQLMSLPNESISLDMWQSYGAVHEAIHFCKRVWYCGAKVRTDGSFDPIKQCKQYFTPVELYLRNNRIYMYGYNHRYHKIMAVDISSISLINLDLYNKGKYVEKAKIALKEFPLKSICQKKYFFLFIVILFN